MKKHSIKFGILLIFFGIICFFFIPFVQGIKNPYMLNFMNIILVLSMIIFSIIGIIFIVYGARSKRAQKNVPIIESIEHTHIGPWHQYDILLSIVGYGWDDMIEWADYVAGADLENVTQVTVSSLGEQETDITKSYLENDCKCSKMPELNIEKGVLSIAGNSLNLKSPVKIVWINQTRVLRIFSIIDNEIFIIKYIADIIKRSFAKKNTSEPIKPKVKKYIGLKIIGYCITVFTTSALIAGIINKSNDYFGLGVVAVADIIGMVLILWKKIRKILEKFTNGFALKIQNLNVVNIFLKIFSVISCISMGGLLIFGPLNLETPTMVCVVTGIFSMPAFFFSIYTSSGFFMDKRTVVFIKGDSIHINSDKFLEWVKKNPDERNFVFCAAVQLKGKEPVISLYEDKVKTKEYCLQTEDGEDFNKKYFLFSVRLSLMDNQFVPVAQIDGFISDTPKNRPIETDDIGYRMEGHYLACGGTLSKQRYDAMRGQDLVAKGLKYPGYTTPANVRLIGVCPECGKSFAFHGYAFYMMQSDVAYSDDGLYCCEILSHDIDKDTWTYESDGKIFRYYNSFNCPYCGTPYIDYKKYHENKVFGVSGCVHLGKKYYREE
ncbi:MAG: hypothetical protein E7394_04730 [Ruminococcaceae bacterium]|nr:hypothetical protein [Oscillospiraceae bacterium]